MYNNTYSPKLDVDERLCDPQQKGLKRKYPGAEDGWSSPATKTYHRQQCQRILKMNCEKLGSLSRDLDSTLLRYVLLLNTSSHITQEMEKDRINTDFMSGSSSLLPINYQVSTPNSLPSFDAFATHSKTVLPPVSDSQTPPSENLLSNVKDATGYNSTFAVITYDEKQSDNLRAGETNNIHSVDWDWILNSNSDTSDIENLCSPAFLRCGLLDCGQSFDEFNCSSSGNGISVTSVVDDTTCSTETSQQMLVSPVMYASSNSLPTPYSSNPSNSRSTNLNSNHTNTASDSSPSTIEDEIIGDTDMILYDSELLSPPYSSSVQIDYVSAVQLMESLSNNSHSADHLAIVDFQDRSKGYTHDWRAMLDALVGTGQ